MSTSQPVGGRLRVTLNGVRLWAKGEFTYNLGRDLRKPVVGQDGSHGWIAEPQSPRIKGTITVHRDLDVAELCEVRGQTLVLEIAGGKSVVLRDAFAAMSGDVNASTGEMEVDFVGASCEEA